MRRTSTAAIGLLTGTLVAALAGPAHAATSSTISVNVDDQSVRYLAGSGQVNNPTVSRFDTGDQDNPVHHFTVHDVAAITPGAGCSWPDPADRTTAECLVNADQDDNPRVVLDLGDRADRSDFLPRWDYAKQGSPGFVTVLGGPGDDVLDGGGKAPGVPLLDGGAKLDGGTGNDTLTNASIVFGGDGDDRISGAGFVRGDGGNDDITGIDDLSYTGQYAGGPGNDTIHANGGDDYVWGNSGNDLLYGGRGNDELSGGPGNDRIYGNSGDDLLVGGPGKDFLSGGPGDDVER